MKDTSQRRGKRLSKDAEKLALKNDELKMAKSRINDEIRAHNENVAATMEEHGKEVEEVKEH